jgi:hypothetical protein
LSSGALRLVMVTRRYMPIMTTEGTRTWTVFDETQKRFSSLMTIGEYMGVVERGNAEVARTTSEVRGGEEFWEPGGGMRESINPGRDVNPTIASRRAWVSNEPRLRARTNRARPRAMVGSHQYTAI